LAVAEEVKASGKDILLAYVLSYEAATRVGRCMSGTQYFKVGFHSCGTWACFGTTAASAKLLNLTVDQLRSAWGIAASAAGGLRTAYGTMTKPLHSAYSARSGVLAAKLAQNGMTGNISVLERDPEARSTAHRFFSFPVVFGGLEEPDLSKVTERLGRHWYLTTQPPTEKFHPGVSATFIDLTEDMMKQHNIVPDQIERVDFYCTPANMDIAGQFPDPQESDAARYSIWYAIAAMLLDGEVGIKMHRLDRLRRDDIRQMIKRIHANEVSDAHLEIYSKGDISDIYADARIEIKLKDGKKYSGTRGKAKGDWRLPLPEEDFLNKYRTCAGEALSENDVERSIELLHRLEELPDVNELMGIIKG
jgi:2-methylcitrate dehydratase PrpD